MKTIFIGIGISGSGKSTFLKTMCPTATYLNADSIREELCGDASDQTRNKEVFDTLYNRIADEMHWDGWDTIIDNTSLTESDRNKIYQTIIYECNELEKSYPNIVLVYIKPDLEKAKFWNRQRERQVPEHVIDKQFARIQPPTEAERAKYKVVEITLG